MKRFFALLSLLLSIPCLAVTVEDNQETFSINYIPQHAVVLEYSFIEALAVVGVSPVDIVDDKNSGRINTQNTQSNRSLFIRWYMLTA